MKTKPFVKQQVVIMIYLPYKQIYFTNDARLL